MTPAPLPARPSALLLLVLPLLGCAAGDAHHHHRHSPAGARNDPLAAIAAVHGGHGPWAVAGYRMGAYALERLGPGPNSFDLEVVHHSPREVQYACVADGAAAATGASVGKLNLLLEPAPLSELRTEYRRRSTGETLTLRFTAAFAQRYLNVARERLAEAGREVLTLKDEEIFEEVK
ncbi:MAG: FmdE family protein [Myxococcales bacterium]